ncbi:MAG TPA: FkbM family methyltransferase [Steroidobacteraceae bacterium]|nr:FkbM family methyltransferase [Steroidobacteraceae bacterium]
MNGEHICLIDVGARNGIDARWNQYWSMLDVIAFEPEPTECARLNAQIHPYSIRYLPNALGAVDAERATLYLCRSPACSSLLKPNLALCNQFPYGHAMAVVSEVPVTLSRMDTVVDVQPDIIKVDTQGTEIDVLRGAGHLLDRTMVVELEVEFVAQYENQPLFADVDSFMRANGFTLRGLRRTYWRNKAASYSHSSGGQLMHGDALYIRYGAIDNPKGHLILAAYKQYDLLCYLGATDLVPKPNKTFQLLGKVLGKPNRELRRFVDSLRSSNASDWHDPDFF